MARTRRLKVRELMNAARACFGLALAGSACAKPPVTTAVAPRSSCGILASQPPSAETISVAASGPIDRLHAPVPRNGTERFVFAQLYETLIDVDCEGHAYPGLAKSWTLDDTRTRVTLIIRDSAQFWNGRRVSAPDVVAAWRATGAQSLETSRLARQMADAATIVDDHTLTVSLPDTAWRVLADPALAVYLPPSAPGWAEGTSPYRVADDSRASQGGGVLLKPVLASAGPYVAVGPVGSNDARDAIDRGVDVLVTDDPVVIGYATTHLNLSAVPLPWLRSYVLAIPWFGPSDSEALRPLTGDSAAVTRASIARDAVRAEARAAEPPYWWSDLQSCEPLVRDELPRNTTGTRPMRIAYDARDRVARGLAERFAALGHGSVATPLPTEQFLRSLHDGAEPAYVIELPHTSLGVCNDAAEVVALAPWIRPCCGEAPLAAPPKLIPLVDTRSRAIVNRDRVSATIDWDGTLRLAGSPRTP